MQLQKRGSALGDLERKRPYTKEILANLTLKFLGHKNQK